MENQKEEKEKKRKEEKQIVKKMEQVGLLQSLEEDSPFEFKIDAYKEVSNQLSGSCTGEEKPDKFLLDNLLVFLNYVKRDLSTGDHSL